MNDLHLTYEVKDKAAWLTINRPDKRNAISPEAMTLFAEALDKAEQDENVRVVVVTDGERILGLRGGFGR